MADRNGNLYGATELGGKFNSGVIFELQPQSGGVWTETILYNFCSVGQFCLDGADPQGGLILDTAGNLYGTTAEGGNCAFVGLACGTVFELSPPQNGGSWTETVLHNFCLDQTNGCVDGGNPQGQLAADREGNLYGITQQGGAGHWPLNNGAGLAFEVSPGLGGWTETTLYNFCSLGSGSACPDGAEPMSGVTFDAAGNLYGTTYRGGGSGGLAYGVVYELSHSAGGWAQSILSTFFKKVATGAAVSLDPAGNLYSTTQLGGIGAGTVFKIAPDDTRSSFSFNYTNGNQPIAGVFVDPRNGSLYGTTEQGGSGFGNVFKLTQAGKLTVLYDFCSQSNCTDGETPASTLLGKSPGILYGTTLDGGANGQGVVFEITP